MADKALGDILKDGNISKNNQCQTVAGLSEYLKSSVKKILDNVTDEKFVSIYKTCYKEFQKKDNISRPALSGSSTEGRKYHTQFNDIVTRSTVRTIEETVVDMSPKLKELEEFVSAQSDDGTRWRPPGNAQEHIHPFEYVSEMEKKKELESKVESEQEALEILKGRLAQKRNKAKELHEVLLTLTEEVEKIVTTKVNG